METLVVPFLITYGSKYVAEYVFSGITSAVVNKAVTVAKDKVKNEWYKISKKNKDIIVYYEYVDPNIDDDKIIYVSSKNEDDVWDKMSTELKEFKYEELKEELKRELSKEELKKELSEDESENENEQIDQQTGQESFMTVNEGSYNEDFFISNLKDNYLKQNFLESVCLDDSVIELPKENPKEIINQTKRINSKNKLKSLKDKLSKEQKQKLKESLIEDLLCTPSTGIIIMPTNEMDTLEI